MASITATKLLPYPSHPYRDSADLAQLLLDNGLTGISVRDLADRMGGGWLLSLKGYWYAFPAPVTGSSRT